MFSPKSEFSFFTEFSESRFFTEFSEFRFFIEFSESTVNSGFFSVVHQNAFAVLFECTVG